MLGTAAGAALGTACGAGAAGAAAEGGRTLSTCNHNMSINKSKFLFVQCFTCAPDGQFIKARDTYFSVAVRLLSGETLLQKKNSTGHRWD